MHGCPPGRRRRACANREDGPLSVPGPHRSPTFRGAALDLPFARILFAVLLLPLIILTVLPSRAQGQGGLITGTVQDAETARPIAGAQVFIPGTVVGTLSDAAGEYGLEGVPIGEVTVTVRLIGYKEATSTVTVAAGRVATVDFELRQTPLRLQDVVVTGVAAETPRLRLPFKIERLDPQDLPVPASDPASLIAGKAPGVAVVSGTGQPGTAASILLRGPTSIDASGRTQTPLIVIDGVIQSESATLADINTLDIDHIEIAKGAAAASLYGSRAQSGVIQITTKRGTQLSANAIQTLVRGEYGASSLPRRRQPPSRFHPYKMNESRTSFVNADGEPIAYSEGVVLDGTDFTAFRDKPWPGPTFDNVARFFDPDAWWSGYGAVTGRHDRASFRVSFESFGNRGNVEGQRGFRRHTGRLNLDILDERGFDFGASAFYSTSWQDDLAEGDLDLLDHFPPVVDLGRREDPLTGEPCSGGSGCSYVIRPDPLSVFFNPLYVIEETEIENGRGRIMGSVDLAWSPVPWLSAAAIASYDRTDFERVEHTPKGFGPPEAESDGSLAKRNFWEEAINASLSASLYRTFLDGDLTARAQLRYLAERQDFDMNGVSGVRFSVDGVPNFGAVEGPQRAENEVRTIKAEGYFATAGLDYRGRYILDGLVRRDGSSLFGPEKRWHTYARGSAAWRISQEDWWTLEWWDELKLRFSYGTAGGRPNFFAHYETYAVSFGFISSPEIFGNAALKPERSAEREAGIDLVLFGELALDLTHAWTTTDDQILLVPQPAPTGFTARWLNAGQLRSNTWEASARWSAIDRPDLGLAFRLNWDRTRHEVTRLDLPPFTQADFFVVAEGEPLGSFWGTKFAANCNEVARAAGFMSRQGFPCEAFQVNDDGFMVYVGEGNRFTDGIANGLWGTSAQIAGTTFDWGIPIETRAQSRFCLREHPEDAGVGDRCPLISTVPLGNSTPDWNAAFATEFRYRGLRLYALLDASVGHEVGEVRFFATTRDIDEGDKPQELRKPIAYYRGLNRVEDASYVKLRELSLAYALPRSVLDRVLEGALDRVTLQLIGRNLVTWTGYSGYDPEVGFEGGELGSAGLTRLDARQYPSPRTLTFSVQAVF